MNEIFYFVLVILVFTRIFGEISARMGQTVLVGELVSGVVLGAIITNFSTSFPVLSGVSENEVFQALTSFGIFFLMLRAGMELEPKDLARAGRRSIVVALFSLLMAFVLGAGLGHLFLEDSPRKYIHIFFLCIIIAITAVPILVKSLMDLEILDRSYGKVMVSAAFFVEVAALIFLVLLTDLIKTNTLPNTDELFEVLGRISMFFVMVYIVGKFIFPIVGKLLRKVVSDEFEFSALVIFALTFALMAKAMDMHFLIGAFLAGLFFERKTVNTKTYNTVTTQIEGLTLGFFAPIFFASIGLQLSMEALMNIPFFILALLICSIASKVIGGGLSAKYLGASTRQSFLIGIGLTAKGSLDLIVAGIAFQAGLFDDSADPIVKYMFSAVVIMSIVNTLLAPIAMKFVKTTKYLKEKQSV